jgi:hypothetical protein
MKTDDIQHDPTINPRRAEVPSSIPWSLRQILQILRRFNLVQGKPCPHSLINAETYQELDQYGWVERDERGVYISNAGLEALKQAEEVRR